MFCIVERALQRHVVFGHDHALGATKQRSRQLDSAHSNHPACAHVLHGCGLAYGKASGGNQSHQCRLGANGTQHNLGVQLRPVAEVNADGTLVLDANGRHGCLGSNSDSRCLGSGDQRIEKRRHAPHHTLSRKGRIEQQGERAGGRLRAHPGPQQGRGNQRALDIPRNFPLVQPILCAERAHSGEFEPICTPQLERLQGRPHKGQQRRIRPNVRRRGCTEGPNQPCEAVDLFSPREHSGQLRS